jgi:hypothetical protein
LAKNKKDAIHIVVAGFTKNIISGTKNMRISGRIVWGAVACGVIAVGGYGYYKIINRLTNADNERRLVIDINQELLQQNADLKRVTAAYKENSELYYKLYTVDEQLLHFLQQLDAKRTQENEHLEYVQSKRGYDGLAFIVMPGAASQFAAYLSKCTSSALNKSVTINFVEFPADNIAMSKLLEGTRKSSEHIDLFLAVMQGLYDVKLNAKSAGSFLAGPNSGLIVAKTANGVFDDALYGGLRSCNSNVVFNYSNPYKPMFEAGALEGARKMTIAPR